MSPHGALTGVLAFRKGALATLGASLAMTWMGCSSAEPATESTDADTSSIYALISLEKSFESVASPRTSVRSRTLAEVRFLKATESIEPESIAHLLGDTLDVPRRGTCVQGIAEDLPSLALHTLPPIELVDAGEVSLVTQSGPRLRLAARAYPDVAHLVSGVVYTSLEATTDEDTSPSGTVLLQVTGGPAVPGFSTSFDLPTAVSDVTIAGAPLGGVLADDVVDLDVSWQGANAGDQVVVDVTSIGAGNAPSRWRCTSANGLELRLPPEAIAAGSTVRVEVHRLVEQALQGHPVRAARASVDIISSGTLRRASVDPSGGG